jgi:putative ABC transport system permease protein
MEKATIGERVYRRLLSLYPRDFSDDYADEMARLYRDRVRGEGPASVWLALLSDLARTAPKEQISTVRQDVRHAWRTWRRTPVLGLAATLTLALGVGANTAVFSVVHGVLLRPLPYPEADRLVEAFEDNSRAGGGPFFRVSLLNYLSWVERAQSFDALRPSTAGTSPSPNTVIRNAFSEAPSLPQCSRCLASRRSSGDL